MHDYLPITVGILEDIMGKFFGTDGFRGEVNVKLTAELAYKTGRYLGWYYSTNNETGVKKNDGRRCRIIIGEDTRRSSVMLQNALAAGITASGADVYLMNVTTTPSVSYIARTEGFDCGVMISASHNPYYDNGIKVINGDGSKLGDEEIAKIEEYLDGSAGDIPYAVRDEIGVIYDYSEGRSKYRDFLIAVAVRDKKRRNTSGAAADCKSSISSEILTDEDREYARHIFAGRKIALDCANGSASFIAREVYEALGAEIFITANTPDGFNINDGVGSTHIENLQSFVRKTGAEIGFAYDGDADRCLAADESGADINGDQLMYACGMDLKKQGLLNDDRIAVTVMSNFGLFKALNRAGLSYEKTAVGDRFVWECMSQKGLSLGGEQSGHIIFAGDATTGDGILTSIKVMGALTAEGCRASELFKGCEMYPQTLKNVRVEDKKAAVADERVQNAVKKAEAKLGDTGRVLLRESGTEPVVRVMVEAASKSECDSLCDDIIQTMQDAGVTL